MKHGKPAPSVDTWIEETKRQSDTGELGMVLVHRGVVRATSKAGGLITKMSLTYDAERLDALLGTFRAQKGIAEIRVWINEGELAIGDDIMTVLVAGRFRTDVLPVFEALVAAIKNEVVRERELS